MRHDAAKLPLSVHMTDALKVPRCAAWQLRQCMCDRAWRAQKHPRTSVDDWAYALMSAATHRRVVRSVCAGDRLLLDPAASPRAPPIAFTRVTYVAFTRASHVGCARL